jgi:hypothetical protein
VFRAYLSWSFQQPYKYMCIDEDIHFGSILLL